MGSRGLDLMHGQQTHGPARRMYISVVYADEVSCRFDALSGQLRQMMAEASPMPIPEPFKSVGKECRACATVMR